MKIAVYTSIVGGRDLLREQQCFSSGAEFIAFTDFAAPDSRWDVRPAYDKFDSHRRNAKIAKILAHEFLPDFDYSLWMDGNIRLLVPAERLVERYLSRTDIAFFRHRDRDCAYAEAAVIISDALDDPHVVRSQMQRYRDGGYPERNSLLAGGVILRRHVASVESFNELWWQEISNGSVRDQLSLNYALTQTGLEPSYFPGLLREPNGLFAFEEHDGGQQPEPIIGRALERS